MGKRIVVALGGNALGQSLPEQMAAVKQTARAIAELIAGGNEVVVSHGNGPQVGMLQKAMAQLTRSDPERYIPCPLSVCVAMSQGYIGYDLQNALREELPDRGIQKGVAVSSIAARPISGGEGRGGLDGLQGGVQVRLQQAALSHRRRSHDRTRLRRCPCTDVRPGLCGGLLPGDPGPGRRAGLSDHPHPQCRAGTILSVRLGLAALMDMAGLLFSVCDRAGKAWDGCWQILQPIPAMSAP